MGAVGSAYDNALMESFWGRRQVELFNRRRWKTRIELAGAIHDYIEIWHNPRRRHSALGMRTPIEVETASIEAHGTTTPQPQDRTAADASTRLRRAPAPAADTTPNDDHSQPIVTIPNDNDPPPDPSNPTPPKPGSDHPGLPSCPADWVSIGQS